MLQKKWLVPLILMTLLLQLITLVKESARHSWLLSETEPDCKVPVEEATTDNVSVPLAPMVAVLATEAEEEAKEAVAMAVEAAEAVEAEGTIPALIVCPLMESMSLIPFAVSPQMNGISLATMVANMYSAYKTVPTVSSMLLEQAEEVKKEAGAAQLQLWRLAFRLLKQLPVGTLCFLLCYQALSVVFQP